MGRLHTQTNLKSYGWSLVRRCPPCESAEETESHLLFECPLVSLWQVIKLKLGVQTLIGDSFKDLLEAMVKLFKGKGMIAAIAKIPYPPVIYHIWTARKNSIFLEQKISKTALKAEIERDVFYALHDNHLKEDTDSNREIASLWDLPFNPASTERVHCQLKYLSRGFDVLCTHAHLAHGVAVIGGVLLNL